MGLERNTEIPLEIASIMQAVLILFISAKFTKQWWKAKRKELIFVELLDWSLLNATLRMVAPILLAALGGMLCARVGIFNVGLEGLILIGAFSGIAGNYYTHNVFCDRDCGWSKLTFALLLE